MEPGVDVAEGGDLVFIRSRACKSANCVVRTVTGDVVRAWIVVERREWDAFREGVIGGDFDEL